MAKKNIFYIIYLFNYLRNTFFIMGNFKDLIEFQKENHPELNWDGLMEMV